MSLVGMASGAHATCWAGGDPLVQRLQASVDTSPKAALPAIDAALARLGKAEPDGKEQRAWLLAARTAALVGLLRYEQGEKAAREGLAEAGQDPVLRIELLDQLVAISFGRPAPELKSMLDELGRLRTKVSKGSAAAVCAGNGMTLLQRALGLTEDAMRTGGEAYRTAKAHRLEAQAAYIAVNLSVLTLASGDVEQAGDLANEAADWARNNGFTYQQLLAAFMQARVASSGDPALAAERFLTAAQLSRQLGIPSGAADQGACGALLALGKLDAAEASCRQAERHLDPSDEAARVYTGNILGEIELARGTPAKALARFDDLLSQAAGPAYRLVADKIRRNRATALAQLGRHREAYQDLKTVNEHIVARSDAQRARALADARARFGWDRQRLANAELERDLARAAARDQARRLWLWTAGGWAALLAALLTWVIVTGKRHRRKLERLADEARDIARTKAELLANMSHEIRSPLGSLTLAATRLSQSAEIPVDSRQRAERLGRAGERLIGLLDDLLLFSRIDAGRLPVVAAPFDPRQLLRETALLAEPKVTAVGASLLVEIDEAAPLLVNGDANRLGQILTNLLDNAVRHSGATQIILSLVPAENGQYRVTVADNGIGIPAERRELMFQRFAQIDGSGASSEGSGLGLAICKGLAELMGGEIRVEGAARGVRISVTMPRSIGSHASAPLMVAA
ncbi:ATP-binding protein [Novosphingobium sp. CECT 9465]|uniref:sensor histidine kinase n=1 Tax=Novosphingobium sp. CECT 9465 TaxID=2829794 RepID=UPI001E45AF79|nr:ATP-binding protein [Novosphingobium sp. CECT 9465]